MVLVLFLFLIFIPAAHAFPNLINIQGKLTDAQRNALTGTHNFTFTIYNAASAGTALYSENLSLNTSQGLFDALIGSNNTLDAQFNESYWIDVQVNGETMSPRIRLASSPYAYVASNLSYNATALSNLYVTGLLGANTTTPGNPLSVQGDANITGTLTVGSCTGCGGGSTTLPAANISSGTFGANADPNGNYTFPNNVTVVRNFSVGSILFVDNATGNVGIGTGGPGKPLHVNAGTTNAGIRFESTDADAVMEFKDDSSSANPPYIGGRGDDLILGRESTIRMILKESGNVGINTTSPGHLLSLSGQSGDTILNITDGTRTLGFYAGTLSGGQSGVSLGAFDENPLHLYTNNTDKLTILANGSVGIGTTSPLTLLEVNATAPTFSFNNGTGTRIIFTGNASGDVVINSTTTANILAIDESTGNVGIGTTSPSAKLEVNASGAAFDVQNTTGSSKFFVNTTSGNVGIGTGAPGSLLHVKGSSPQLIVEGSGSSNIPGQIKVGPGGSTSSMVELYRTTDDITAAAPTDYERLTFGFNQWVVDSEAFIGTEKGGTGSNRALLLMMGSSEIMRLATDGNVGIGTTSPLTKLHVAGNVFVNNTGVATSTASYNSSDIILQTSSWNGTATTPYNASLRHIATNGTGNLTRLGVFVNGSERVSVDSQGRVGIGTASPVSRFYIRDTSGSDVKVRIEDDDNSGTDATWGFFISNSLGAFGIWDNESNTLPLYIEDGAPDNAIYIDSSGDVGIGTNIPDHGNYKLNVAGNINASAHVTNGTDYAEWMEKMYSEETLEEGDVVAVNDGKVTKQFSSFSEANSFLVVSERAGFVGGNSNADNGVVVAFIGQVPVKVRGEASAGDYVLADEDGTAVAKPKSDVTFDEYKQRVIGTAWESKETQSIGTVIVAVGIK